MEPRTGNMKANFTRIARELNLSVMTIYRVVNQSPRVSNTTRRRVTEALNRNGYFIHRKMPKSQVLFDFNDHYYLRWMGEQLIRRLSEDKYLCVTSEHRKKETAFLDAAAESDIVVFCSAPSDAIIRKVRKVNRNIYSITITTESCADVTITPNNKFGGELVARHLHQLGQDHIAVFLSDGHPTRMERYKSFRGEMAVLNPLCRIDEILHRQGELFEMTLESYFSQNKVLPGVIFFPAGGFAQEFWDNFVQKEPERFRNVGIMSYDRPEDLFWEHSDIRRFDRIEFDPQTILDWAEYYITNRPMMKITSPVHTCVNSYLVIEGSVANKQRNQ